MKTKRIKVFENEVEADLFLTEGKVLGVVAERRKICLVRFEGKIYAMPDNCPHQNFPLSKGFCSPQGEILCPWHKFSFGLKDGLQTRGKGYFLKMMQVELADDGVFVLWPLTLLESLFQ